MPDIVPKLIEISMSAGSFVIFENAKILLNGKQIGYVRIQKPNHKFGDTGRPEVAAGLGSPSTTVEEYTIDPYDRSRPAPSSTYSATSQLLNIDVIALGNLEAPVRLQLRWSENFRKFMVWRFEFVDAKTR